MHIVMTYTNFGRQVYAVGADEEAATRAGINVKRVRLIVFLVCGIICGIAGVWSNILWPNNTFFIMVLFNNCCHSSTDADSI